MGATLCFPEVALAVCAGVCFSFPVALLATWVGGMMGASVTFLLGRRFLRAFITRLVFDRSASARSLDEALGRLGWRLLVIIRLPYLPFVHVNVRRR